MDSEELKENAEAGPSLVEEENGKSAEVLDGDDESSHGQPAEEQASGETSAEEEDFKSKFYYLAAEMENSRKRFEREKQNLLKYGNENLLSDLLEVLDNFERTIGSIENEQDEKIKNLYTGIEMVHKQFLQTLEKFGLSPIESLKKTFDPNFHEAVGQEESGEAQEQEIIKEYQRGYTLNGRVLRASKVVIAK